MADLARRLPENVAGDFFVDATCIDCDACRQIAPETFRDHGDQSSVYRQPATEEETRRALMALVACPTGSIGSARKTNARTGIEAFPTTVAENVYFCGFTSESSFGAWSYLIVRPRERGGNVLVDSPRFSGPLVKRIEALGGINQLFLTHRDDIADHAKFARRFGCERIMHADDGARRLPAERVVEGEEAVRLDEDLLAIPTPGHTRGHMVLLYRDKYLFTGDHLSWSPSKQTLTAFRTAMWYSWPAQTRSMEKLRAYDFEWVLPGHGRIRQDTRDGMRAHLERCIEWMKATP
ncbi:MAG TPA: MBL fold metallo-hydrolase, partial [Pyrinomonadaceae bacterium]|jgi:glyoxylase-like metal-dependent hydrolase (beta-lactamase superfamily II)/ferredoxin|nr:MBL fold metallo-hydrolase [Pyrinomonadaceae bacterium]